MAEKVIADYDDIKAIADAIRDETNTSQNLTLEEMPYKIQNIKIPYCSVTFPVAALNDTLYYTDENGYACSYTRDKAEILNLKVLRNTIIYCDTSVFDSDTYILDNEDSADIISKYAIVIKGVTSFTYADNAPI